MTTEKLHAILLADGTDDFVSSPVAEAILTFGGLAGDLHAGLTRRACVRVPWHPRGARIANTRQLSLVSVAECAEIALLLDVPEVDPALLGANLVLDGIAELSALPPSTRLQFPSGATVFVTEENAPCGQPGARLARAFGRPALQRAFARLAVGRRGLLGLVEREGPIAAGDSVTVIAVPERRQTPALPERVS